MKILGSFIINKKTCRVAGNWVIYLGSLMLILLLLSAVLLELFTETDISTQCICAMHNCKNQNEISVKFENLHE